MASEYKKMFPPEVLKGPANVVDGYVAQMLEQAKASQKAEAAFYSMLGLNDAFSTCAVGDAADAKFPVLKGKKGWGFSIPDMERLGLNNITYVGDGLYEKSSANFVKYLGLLSADDCLSLLRNSH